MIIVDSFDEVWILPVYRHIYDTKQNLASYYDRLNMCKLEFENIVKNNVKISDLEEVVFNENNEEFLKNPTELKVLSKSIYTRISQKELDR